MSKSKVTTEQFVLIYMQQGGVLDNVANELGLNRATVYQRVRKLRKAGVRLPVKKKGKTYNVRALNDLIREYKKGK